MATNFFSRFPQIDYNMDGEGSFLTLTNIVKNVDVNDLYANNSTFYTYHEIMDGERPDTISYRIYGTPNYYWTFFILNNDLRAGLNSAWPLSNQQLERMFVQEYDPYTAITFIPTSVTANGIGSNGLMNLVYLWEAYLPYLRLTNPSGTEWAKILKYDNHTLQLIIYDIEKSDGSGAVSSRDTFKNSEYFKIAWNNPYDENSIDSTEVTNWENCEAARLEFISRTQESYLEFDTQFAQIDPAWLDGLTQEEIDLTIANYNEGYVFSKVYLPAAAVYRWSSYRDAASEYYETIDGVNYSTAAYDTVLDENIVAPQYITFFAREELINSRKTKIRVIRADKIVDFVNAYFNTLNAQ